MSRNLQNLFRKIPSVDILLTYPEIVNAMSSEPKSLVLTAIHEVLDQIRLEIKQGALTDERELDAEKIITQVTGRIHQLSMPSLRHVVNATGVVVHTNLGRSLLADRVLDKFRSLAGGYSNLEYSLAEGRRGSRYVHVEYMLKELTGAEAAMVVNNNAAAVLISLETLAKDREVIVSRGQLVEIGGSFRIPDVMRKSGAKMVEVGTTNKTHLRDFESAVGPETALLLKVHTSNFQVVGFTEEVSMAELSALGKQHGIPVMEDLGSGCLINFSEYGMIHEPTVQEALAGGADVVTFSGDKLLGGPQAGIILGREDLVSAIRQNQLNRALRIDKLTLLALEETLRIYRDSEKAVARIPTLRMICSSYEDLRDKAGRLENRLRHISTRNFTIESTEGFSKVGGGALPLQQLKTRLLCLVPGNLSAQHMEKLLRSYDPPIIGRLEKDRLMLDVRTIQDNETDIVANAVQSLANDV